MRNSKGKMIMCLGLILILSVVILSSANAAFFGLFGSKKNVEAKNTIASSLVVFPFDQDLAMNLPDAFGQIIADDVKSMLNSNSKYQVYLFKERLAPISRAKSENVIKPGDAEPPYSEDMSKSLVLSKLLAMDYMIVGSIDEYKVDASQKAAIVTLSVQLYDTKTGKLNKTILVTGKTPENTDVSTEEELRDIAKGDAVARLIAEITAPAKSAQPTANASAAPASDSQK